MHIPLWLWFSYVGIDVAKARVDVAVRPSGDIWSDDYDEAGIEGLATVHNMV